MNAKLIVPIILSVIVLVLVNSTFFIVNETQKGVKRTFLEITEPDLQPGLDYKIPWIQEAELFDGRIQVLDTAAGTFLTNEKKYLVVDSYVIWRIADVEKFVTAAGYRNLKNLVEPRVNEGLRNKFGERTVQEAVSGEREELMDEVTEEVNKQTMAELGVEVLDIRVKKVEYSDKVVLAVFARMSAEREREAREHRSQGNEQAEKIRAEADKKQRVIRAEAYREAEKIRGEGDAEAAAIYAKAYSRDPEFYAFYRSMLAYEKTFSNKGDLMVLDPESDYFRYMEKSKGSR